MIRISFFLPLNFYTLRILSHFDIVNTVPTPIPFPFTSSMAPPVVVA